MPAGFRPWLVFILFTGLASAAEFTDPAPPVVNVPPAMPAPAARPHPKVKVVAKPKALPAGAVTHDWTTFLGPTHNCTSTETKLLKKWGPSGPPVLWELTRGTGYSSPAIQGEHLVYIHREDAEEVVECLRAEDGALFWQLRYPSEYEDRYGYNNGPRASPVIDGERVYTYGVEGTLHCLLLATGQVLWKRNLNAEFKIKPNFFGVGTNPLVEKNLLIVNVGAKGGPGVVAFDKMTGKMVWGCDDQWGPSYGAPIPANVHGQRRIFVFSGGESRPATGGLLCLNPENGALDFRFFWRSKTVESVNAASPVVIGNQVFVSASYDTGGALITVTPELKHEVAWTTPDFGTHWNTAVHKDGYLYGFDGRHSQNASLVCFEVKTGKEMWRETPSWQEEIVANGAKRKMEQRYFRGSLLSVDGHFLCLGEMGHLAWLDMNEKGYKELARAWLFPAPETWSLPVVSRGLLYISQHHKDVFQVTGSRLICYDLRGE